MLNLKTPTGTIVFHTCDFHLECRGFVKHKSYSFGHTFLKANIEIEINYVFQIAIFSIHHKNEYHIAGWTDISIPRVAAFMEKANIQ